MALLLEKMGEVAEAHGIEQAQAGEVAGFAELLGRGGEEKNARHCASERFDDAIFGAGKIRAPLQVMRLVDDQDVPTGGEGLGGATFLLRE